jgi:nitroreductase
VEKNINQIIKERRSIFPKEYSGQILPENVIETLLENANFAPNHHSNYPWRFIVVSPSSIKNWLFTAAEIYRIKTSLELFKQDKYDKLIGFQNQISHAIAIVLHRDHPKTKEIEDISAVACAVQNMYLSLSQFENAAGYWSTGLGTSDKEMSEYFQLKDEDTLMGFFVLGHVSEKRTLGNRRNYKNFVKFI